MDKLKFKVFYSKAEERVFVSIISFVIGISLGVLANAESSDFIKLVITLTGTFTGAFLAFKFARKNETIKEDDANVRASNSAITKFIRSYNHFTGYKNQFIEPHRNSPLNAFEILPSIGTSQLEIALEVDSLSYIFKKDPELLQKSLEIKDEINTTAELIRIRNELHRDEVQRKMDAASFINGQQVTGNDIRNTLGEGLFSTMSMITKSMISSVDDLCESIEEIIEKLADTTKEIYPNHTVVRMKKLNEPKQRDANT